MPGVVVAKMGSPPRLQLFAFAYSGKTEVASRGIL
jgi:hypothetical protein